MDEIYSPGEYSIGYPEGIEFNFWNLARNDLLYGILASVVKDDELVMDVGCGPGIFLASVQDKSINARGVERGSPVLKPSLESIIDTGTDLFDLDLQLRQKIKVVVLLDVIEHIADRQEFLQRIYSQLPNCQYLLVTVPARMEVWSNFDRDWGHYLRYDRPGLDRELAAGGFKTIRSGYYFQWVYLAMLVMKMLGVERGSDFKSPTRSRATAFLHRVLGFFTRVESRLVPGFFAGSSIVCLAAREEGNLK
jgi:hypothetical protein